MVDEGGSFEAGIDRVLLRGVGLSMSFGQSNNVQVAHYDDWYTADEAERFEHIHVEADDLPDQLVLDPSGGRSSQS